MVAAKWKGRFYEHQRMVLIKTACYVLKLSQVNVTSLGGNFGGIYNHRRVLLQ